MGCGLYETLAIGQVFDRSKAITIEKECPSLIMRCNALQEGESITDTVRRGRREL